MPGQGPMALKGDKRFWQNVEIDAVTKCWMWRGAVVSSGGTYDGYGLALWTPKPKLAIRYVFDAIGRGRADGHRPGIKPACANYKLCVNPAHWTVRGGGLSESQMFDFAAICELTGAKFRMDRNWKMPEQIAAHLARTLIAPRISFPQLGDLTYRDHSSVINAIQKIAQTRPGLCREYERRAMSLIGRGVSGGSESRDFAEAAAA